MLAVTFRAGCKYQCEAWAAARALTAWGRAFPTLFPKITQYHVTIFTWAPRDRLLTTKQLVKS